MHRKLRLQSHATQQGSNTLIDFGSGNTITLQNVTLANLVAADFVFNNSVTGTSANDVLVGTMTPGRLGQFVLYAVFAAAGLGQLSEVWGELSAASGAAERLFEILNIRPAIVAPRRSTVQQATGFNAGARNASPVRKLKQA